MSHTKITNFTHGNISFFSKKTLLEVQLAGASARHIEGLPVDKIKVDVMNFLRRRLAKLGYTITMPTDVMVM